MLIEKVIPENILFNSIKNRIEQIMAQREEIVTAFIAENGCLPSECEQVVYSDPIGSPNVHYFIRKREDKVNETTTS